MPSWRPNVNAVIGGYYFKQETDYYSYQDLRYINTSDGTYAAQGLGVFPLQFIQPDRTPADAKAAFANLNWEIVPGLTFDGGVRYTKESKQYHYFRLESERHRQRLSGPGGCRQWCGISGCADRRCRHL